jgi:hypothetical protein
MFFSPPGLAKSENKSSDERHTHFISIRPTFKSPSQTGKLNMASRDPENTMLISLLSAMSRLWQFLRRLLCIMVTPTDLTLSVSAKPPPAPTSSASTSARKLVSVRRVSKIDKIKYTNLAVAHLDGWQVVVGAGRFKVL